MLIKKITKKKEKQIYMQIDNNNNNTNLLNLQIRQRHTIFYNYYGKKRFDLIVFPSILM